ncbi:MAG TPA: hypothetical protein VHN80_15070 [Kineosporiaceae bacterium]|jgi:hypothetical protein|nr:hypothetical protein [Kineosporiaceae bacterium]
MTIDVVLLREWCDQVCRLSATDVRDVVAALGLPDDLGTPARDVTELHPPPSGTTRCAVGTSDDHFWYLSLTFTTPTIARHTLEDAMGPGVLLRRIRSTRLHRVAYRVVIPDAPFSCDLVASFTEAPTDASLVAGVTLRRDRGVGPVG